MISRVLFVMFFKEAIGRNLHAEMKKTDSPNGNLSSRADGIRRTIKKNASRESRNWLPKVQDPEKRRKDKQPTEHHAFERRTEDEKKKNPTDLQTALEPAQRRKNSES